MMGSDPTPSKIDPRRERSANARKWIRIEARTLEWIRVLGPVFVSWPTVVLVIVIVFRLPIQSLFDRFTQSTGSKAALGPISIELGTPVLPPQYRAKAAAPDEEIIDLSQTIGSIRDTGAEGAVVGFSVAYAMQAAIKNKQNETVTLSPRGVYELAKKYDEWPGESYEGTSLEGGIKAVRDVGAYREEDWPYGSKAPRRGSKPAYKISEYSELKGIEQLLNALRDQRVVIASVQVTADFDSPGKDGTVTIRLPLQISGGSTIALVGYNSKTAAFTFANQWGTGWGRNGFGLIGAADLIQILTMAYQLEI